MKKIFLLPVSLVLFFILSGCAPGIIKPPPAMPSLSPEEILAKITQRVPVEAVLRSRARFSVDSPRGRFSTGIVLLAERPHFLRIESISMLGLPDLILTSNGRELKIFAVKERKFYVGSAGENLSRYFPIHLEPGEAVRLILGLPPWAEREKAGLKGSMDGDLYRIELPAAETGWTLWLDPSDLVIRRVEKRENGERVYLAELDGYGSPGMPVPGRLEIQFDKPEKTKVSLRYPDRELDRTVSAGDKEDFDLEPPEGIAPILLD